MSEQQDPQEFNKLFFDKMKTLMSSVTDCTLGKFQYSTKCCSLGQITNVLFDVGGQYRRNM